MIRTYADGSHATEPAVPIVLPSPATQPTKGTGNADGDERAPARDAHAAPETPEAPGSPDAPDAAPASTPRDNASGLPGSY
jgi:hypothetical protein